MRLMLYDYRGSTVDLVRAFLGREPSNAEFLRLRGMG
jgi:hypothetical protein